MERNGAQLLRNQAFSETDMETVIKQRALLT